MTTVSQTDKTCNISQDKKVKDDFLAKISHILKQYSAFNFFFILIGTFELLLCLVFFNLLVHMQFLAITLATFLMTLFSYFILKTYFQNKKPQNLLAICVDALNSTKEEAQSLKNMYESKTFVANSLLRLASSLKDQEYEFYKPFKSLQSLQLSFEKLSAYLHWKDFHLIKEWLFFEAIEQYVSLIKENPSHLQLHVELANAYVMLSRIYSSTVNDPSDQTKWIPQEKLSEKMKLKFKNCAERAVEEFKILNDYNPEDPWVYTQLAYSYHDLKMHKEEISAYETIAKLCPDDFDNLFKLGTRYFQEGFTAKGLKIYEILKREYPKRAESLIKYYGHYDQVHLFD